jgi:hypothetical protein
VDQEVVVHYDGPRVGETRRRLVVANRPGQVESTHRVDPRSHLRRSMVALTWLQAVPVFEARQALEVVRSQQPQSLVH